MGYLIGMDEAGYGPNLGPLVISATVWHVEDERAEVDLYTRLAEVVTSTSDGRRESENPRIAIADSKSLYRSKKSIVGLERGLLAALGAVGAVPDSWQQLWNVLAPDSLAQRNELPWYFGYDRPLPLEMSAPQIEALVLRLREGLAAARVELVTVKSRAVFPAEFNRMTEHLGTKGATLTELTIRLLVDVMRPLDDAPVSIIADKHGGRNRYAAVLESQFPDSEIQVCREGRQESHYRWVKRSTECEIRFRAKAESHLPTALASMASKYLRETAMRAFNAFWCGHVRDLRPTAGYPQDAKRFRAEIRVAQAALGIDDDKLWRAR